MVTQRRLRSREGAEALAVQAFSFIAGDPEQLGRFLAITGIEPDQIRAAAQEPHFLAGVLDHIGGDERLLVSFATQIGIDPAEVAKARNSLGGDQQGEIP
jgi:hypothetical protein